jgi:hypothetical protein
MAKIRIFEFFQNSSISVVGGVFWDTRDVETLWRSF